MEGLPQELIDKISSYLPRRDLCNVLTLTGKFRFAAERHCGAFSKFTINENNSVDFLARFSSHRLLYLKEVIFRPTFPTLCGPRDNEDDSSDDDQVLCREPAHEVYERDESFTRQIQFLFHILQLVEKQAGEKHAPGRYRLSLYSPIRTVRAKNACPHRYRTSWRVRLLEAELSPVASIRSFEIYNNYGNESFAPYLHIDRSGKQEFKLDLRVLIDLAIRMPNLEYLGFRTGGYEWCESFNPEMNTCIEHYEHDWAGPRRDARHDFADAIIRSLDKIPKTLRHASLDFLSPLLRATDIHHGKPLPDLVGHLTYDPFTSSLGMLCNNLRHLQLRAMIDESLLLTPSKSLTELHVSWPRLEILDIMFHNARPDGTWYFSGPAGQGHVPRGYPVTSASYPPYAPTELDEDMDYDFLDAPDPRTAFNKQFRVAPTANLTPLLESFAKAAINMPALKEAAIWSPLEWSGKDFTGNDIDYWSKTEGEDDDKMLYSLESLAWGIKYAEPGRHTDSRSCRRLQWVVGDWHPDGELRSLFQAIGYAKHGGELEEVWTEGLAYDGGRISGIGHRGEFKRIKA
ncbi:unnamed protein product [Alternaria alternata]